MSENVTAESRLLPSAAVKICGLSRPEDIIAVNAVRADYAGFVFYEKSKRNLSFSRAERLLARLDQRIQSVAVCVSPDEHMIAQILKLGFDIIQIHGTIPIRILEQIPIPVWQAVNLESSGKYNSADSFCQMPQITGYVIDGAKYGGGRTFGWDQDPHLAKTFSESVREAAGGRLFILAGGLNPQNVQAGIQLLQPDVADVSSGVEKNGLKDYDLIEQFVGKVRER